jgi:hypothetical protein
MGRNFHFSKNRALITAYILSSALVYCSANADIEWFTTTRDGSKQLYQMPSVLFSSSEQVGAEDNSFS